MAARQRRRAGAARGQAHPRPPRLSATVLADGGHACVPDSPRQRLRPSATSPRASSPAAATAVLATILADGGYGRTRLCHRPRQRLCSRPSATFETSPRASSVAAATAALATILGNLRDLPASVLTGGGRGHGRSRDLLLRWRLCPRPPLRPSSPAAAPLRNLPASVLADGGLVLSPLAFSLSSRPLAASWSCLILTARRRRVAFSPRRRWICHRKKYTEGGGHRQPAMGDTTAVMAATGEAAAVGPTRQRNGGDDTAAGDTASASSEASASVPPSSTARRVRPPGRVKRALAAASKSGVETVRGGERIEGHRDGKGSTALEKAGEAVVRKAGGTERGGAVPDDDDDDGDMFEEEEDACSSSLAAASSDLLLESGHHHHRQLTAHPSMANPRIAAALAATPAVVSSPSLSLFVFLTWICRMPVAVDVSRWLGDRPGLHRSASSITDAAHPIAAADREGRRSWRSSSSSEARGSSFGFPRPSSASFSHLLGRSVPELAHAATPPPSLASSSLPPQPPPPRHRLPTPSSPPAGRPAGLPSPERERERRKGETGSGRPADVAY
ncbi:hypothetical protein [Oryza sativa Japonica Group]|uniref:OSJNBb0008G24.3 protein n=1 Tax=Oryza sativa subsp. japonica TaxID=39947 RepID=Q943J0_ORYSJ|nr:hypothetical protein [Oryza sativa Japonica Group]BAB86534.1 OSJNBb0008G24.3 [Oryza sativa Japonica Group]